MGKGNGGTRAGASSSPRGFQAPSPSSSYNSDLEPLAERLFSAKQLFIDPGDATFEPAREIPATPLEDSIEMSTDYIAQADGRGNINIQSKYTPEADAIREYGTERVSIPMGDRSLIDIINELRTSRESDIFWKYR